jgi:hypothetical protein
VNRPSPRTVARLAALLLLGTTAAAGCGAGPDLQPRTTVGTVQPSRTIDRDTVILVADGARDALTAGLEDFTTARKTGMVTAYGTPEEIATSVMHGSVVDAAVLPEGPELDRITGELLTPPVVIGRASGGTWVIAVITSRGLPLAEYLTGDRGRAVLSSHQVTPRAR